MPPACTRAPVVVCSAGVRPAVQRLLAPALPRAVVLSYSELESVELESAGPPTATNGGWGPLSAVRSEP